MVQPNSDERQIMNGEDDGYVIIKGLTTDGAKFRPSDWCDRLYGTLYALDSEDYENCIGYVHLANYNGSRCVLVDSSLKGRNNRLYQFFVRFAESNNLAKTFINKANWDVVHGDQSLS